MRVAITGAATGIGAATASVFKADGAHVTGFDIARSDAAVDDWVLVDLSDPQAVAATVDQVDGPFDALINNAGLPPRPGMATQVLRLNFFGLRQFLHAMLGKLSDGAAVVNTASRAGAMWRDNIDEVKALMDLCPDDLDEFVRSRNIDPTRAYNLSKEAVIVMTIAETQAMAARGLRMNSVSPAAVSTGILNDFAVAFGDRMTRNVARAGRPGTAGEIANVIAFLARPESGWIKGQDIVIDGGMSAMSQCEAFGLL